MRSRRHGKLVSGKLSGMVLACSMVALCAASAQQGDRQVTVEQVPMLNLSAPASTLAIDAWTNRADSTYAIDEDLTLFIRTSYDAWVTVLNVDAVGRTTQLFPNAFATDNRLRGNQVYQLPGSNVRYKLHIGGPAGVNLIKVIASTSPTPLLKGRAHERSGPFDTYQEPAEDLARQIQAVMTKEPRAVWTVADRALHVVSQHAAVQPPPQNVVILAPPVVTTTPIPAPAQIIAPSPATPVALPFGLAGVQSAFALELRPAKASYRVGEELTMTVTPERDCKLTLLSIDAQNNATVLYPNRLEKEPSLRAGRTSFLPGTDGKMKLTLMGNPGVQTLVAMCGEEWSLMGTLSSLFRSSDRAVYPTVSGQTEITQAITAQLQSGRKLSHVTTTFLLTP
jgi:uncharacterized protein DUF4384